jgi:hypothetical protein
MRINPRPRRRIALSEVVGALLSLAITVIAGAAVFGYVNTQAGVTERQYGASVGGTVQFLEERFTVVQLNYTSSKVTIWLYNMGQINLSPVQILVYNNGRSTYLMYNATTVVSYGPKPCTAPASGNENPVLWNPRTSTGLAVPIQTVQKVTLTLPSCSGASFVSGTTYTVSILGVNGNVVVYYQTR